MPNLVKSINHTDDDKAILEGILRQCTVEARTCIRAKILLLKSECRSNEAVEDKLDICVTAVRLCLDKYNTGGIEAALQDNKGRGRKHGSWLNMMESFFGKRTNQMLNGIRISRSYKLDDIDLAKEDISQIVYEVVNHKAANACDKNKRAPKP